MTQINKWLERFRNPVVMMSFGKDSMALGFMIFKMLKLKLPVIYYRDPFDPIKNEWPDKIIHEWGLEVYDYPPYQCRVKVKGEFIELCPSYQIGELPNGCIDVPKAILEPDYKGDWHCGLKILERPKGSFNFPWDLILHGHKSADVDRFYGPVKLKTELVEKDGIPAVAFPLKDWTHDDIWDFIEDFDIPFQQDRYLNRVESADKITNNDYLVACTNCVDPRKAGQDVYCPLVGHGIKNISEQVLQAPALLPDYII
jgi:3'-phosphoadenosine 5'-phosphosulfate sulfotransferase (PAPS reductase)/FAD synthetase